MKDAAVSADASAAIGYGNLWAEGGSEVASGKPKESAMSETYNWGWS